MQFEKYNAASPKKVGAQHAAPLLLTAAVAAEGVTLKAREIVVAVQRGPDESGPFRHDCVFR